VAIPAVRRAVLLAPDSGNGVRDAAELLKKLLAAGLSKYEPNPLQTLAETESKAAS
jgi:hypothetical protein